MKTTYEINPDLDPDLYVRYVSHWRENRPRRAAPVRDIRPYLDAPDREEETIQQPYLPAYILTAIGAVIAIGFVLISLGCG